MCYIMKNNKEEQESMCLCKTDINSMAIFIQWWDEIYMKMCKTLVSYDISTKKLKTNMD